MRRIAERSAEPAISARRNRRKTTRRRNPRRRCSGPGVADLTHVVEEVYMNRVPHPIANRAAIYLRVSSAQQEQDGTSLESQEERCRRYAAERGLTVEEAHVYREVYSGAVLHERPKLAALRQAAREHRIDVVVSYAVDRLASTTLASCSPRSETSAPASQNPSNWYTTGGCGCVPNALKTPKQVHFLEDARAVLGTRPTCTSLPKRWRRPASASSS